MMKIPRKNKRRTRLDKLRATLGTGRAMYVTYQSGVWPAVLKAEGLRVRWRKTERGWAAWVEPLEIPERSEASC
jgi:hypothetical protein